MIRIGRESQCLPYAGFFLTKLVQLGLFYRQGPPSKSLKYFGGVSTQLDCDSTTTLSGLSLSSLSPPLVHFNIFLEDSSGDKTSGQRTGKPGSNAGRLAFNLGFLYTIVIDWVCIGSSFTKS